MSISALSVSSKVSFSGGIPQRARELVDRLEEPGALGQAAAPRFTAIVRS